MVKLYSFSDLLKTKQIAHQFYLKYIVHRKQFGANIFDFSTTFIPFNVMSFPSNLSFTYIKIADADLLSSFSKC
jgi:hypothetical protein